MKSPFKRPPLAISASVLLGMVVLCWMGYEPYRGNGKISVKDGDSRHEDPNGKLVEFKRGTTVRQVVQQAGHPEMDVATHNVCLWRWSAWGGQRAVNRALLLVDHSLSDAKLESAEKMWWSWAMEPLYRTVDYKLIRESDEVWDADLSRGDRIVVFRKGVHTPAED